MITFLAKFGVALHVALMVLWASWARGGSAPAYFWALPWLSLGLLEVMLLLPLRQRGETVYEALVRMLKNIAMDPIFYVGILLLGFLFIQWQNGPLELEYDSTDLVWKYSDPKWENMPFCVNQGEAGQVLIWFSAVLTVLLAVRHFIGPKAKMLLLHILVWNGVLLSFLGFLQLITSPDMLFWYRPMKVFFFATFGYPNHAGSFFLLVSAINMGLFIHALSGEDEENSYPWHLGVALIFNLAAVYASLCRAAIVLASALFLFFIVYGFFYLRRRIAGGIIVKMLAVFVITIGFVVARAAMPNSDFAREVKTINLESMSSVYGGDREILADAALRIWKDHPWTGVGGWGFRRYVGLYIGEEQWDLLQEHGKANVHHDILQFLCEHGAIGGGLMIALAVVLLIHIGIRLVMMPKGNNGDTTGEISWFDSVSPIVVLSLAGCFCVLVHSTVDLPFRSTAVLLLWFITLAILPGFIKRKKK